MKRLSFLLALIALSGCTGKAPDMQSSQPLVAASFYPLAFLADHIAGDAAEVMQMTPAGVEPHDYEPSAGQVARLQNAALFLYNGAGVDEWAERIAPALEVKGVKVLEFVHAIRLLPATEDGHSHAEEPSVEEEHDHEHQGDPHVWLDPTLLASQIPAIRDALIAADPQHAFLYEENASALETRLSDLDAVFAAGLRDCAKRTIIVSHNAFRYLANRYNLEVESIAGLSPDQEPSAQRMAEIAEHAQEEGIDVIFFETLASPKIAETIAREAKARTMVLNPIEGLMPEEEQNGVTYIGLMEQNLQSLRAALQCQ